MAEVREHNRSVLSGVIRTLDETRVSPAGMPLQTLVLEHRSVQPEADGIREARVNIVVRLAGPVVGQAVGLRPGDRVVVTGYLCRASYRDEDRIVLSAITLDKDE